MSAVDPTLPLRETFWNIPLPAIVFVYVGGFIALGLFGWRMWQRVALWRAVYRKTASATGASAR